MAADSAEPVTTRVVSTVARVEPHDWDALVPADEPFLEHGFLRALEESASVGAAAGWTPAYVLASSAGRLVGACAAWMKTHSFGEFVFDWSWADALHRAGGRYYPKWVVAAPFTPVTGRRLLVHDGPRTDDVRTALLRTLLDLVRDSGASGLHVLFCDADETEWLAARGGLVRMGYQFHWQDRGFGSWEGYLAALHHKRRSETQRERRRLGTLGVRVEVVPGADASASDWEYMEAFYRGQAARMGGRAYLTPGFFEALRAGYSHRILLLLGRDTQGTPGGALHVHKGAALYGRYWGSDRPIAGLHFEACYYRAIEYALSRGIQRFEAGAQGEHKLSRGLLPSHTRSVHWLTHRGLHEAVGRFVADERGQVETEIRELAAAGPYRRG